jgi:hypothetical protein
MKITKKGALLISLVGVAVWFLLRNEKILTFLCKKWNICEDYGQYSLFNLNGNFYILFPLNFSSYFLIFFPILLFSSVTYFIKEEVFKAWLKFTYWYFPIYILAILFLSGMGGGFLSSAFSPNFFAISLSGLYIIISFFLVLLLFPLKGSKK